MKECYTKDFLSKAVKESYSLAEVLRKIGKKDRGSNYETLKKYIKKYELDTSHFTGQGWSINKGFCDEISLVKLNEIFSKPCKYSSALLKNRLIKEGFKEAKCEKCGCGDTWCGEPLTLELHHVNGDHYDNRLENLQILCPNCHSQTDSFCRRKNVRNKSDAKRLSKRGTIVKVCENCGKEFNSDRNLRRFCSRECYNEFFKKTGLSNTITKDALLNAFKMFGDNKTKIAAYLNVSRATVRLYMAKYRITPLTDLNGNAIE